jgi:Phytanoyl-CoA dioxygenase (PhyH)
MSVSKIASALDPNTVKCLRSRADAVVQQIRDDYFPTLPDDTFRRDHLAHTSLVMKIAAYRFLDNEIAATLRTAVEDRAREIYGAGKLVYHPVFYLRMSFPGIYHSRLDRTAFMDSQPHYDRAYGVHAFSFWLALNEIDEESGGLATFVDPGVERLFEVAGRNRYSATTYLQAAALIDPHLRNATKTWSAAAGDVLTFDSTVLHGATKPKTRRRISFDFRLAPVETVAAAASEHQRIFAAVNANLTLSNARNLAMLGDIVGARRIFDGLGIAAPPMRFSPKIVEPLAEMRWQEEYAYLRTTAHA